MTIATREALFGASDLAEREVELPSIGLTVRIKSLSAAYSNKAQSEALEMQTVRGEQQARLNVAKLEASKVLHALIDPKLDSLDQALTLEGQLGPAWHALIRAIDEASGISEEAIHQTNTRFQPGGQVEEGPTDSNGVGARDGGPDLPVRTGA